jgi:hypothetical protein
MTAEPQWFRIDLPDRERVEVSATVHGAGGIELELLADDGKTLDRGPGLARTEASGRIYVRVTGTVRSFALAVVAHRSQAVVDGPACDVFAIDPTNPRCAGVVPCDPNHPDFANPTCCHVACIRDCGTKLEPIAGTPFAWIDKGASSGINTRYRGRGRITAADGSVTAFTFDVASVERTRAKVLVRSNVSIEAVAHAVANLRPPTECGNTDN